MDQCAETVRQLEAAARSGDVAATEAALGAFKPLLLQLPGLPPLPAASPTAAAERDLARRGLEWACLCCAQQRDPDTFERFYAQLKTLYGDFGGELGASPNRAVVVGVALLTLLVANDLGAFHSEVELLGEAELADPAVAFAVGVERALMMGSYDAVLAARSQPPNEFCNVFADDLLQTVRDAIADCAEVSYETLDVAAAARMLKLESPAELAAYVEESRPEWSVVGSAVHFRPQAKAALEVPSAEIMAQQIGFAVDLERII